MKHVVRMPAAASRVAGGGPPGSLVVVEQPDNLQTLTADLRPLEFLFDLVCQAPYDDLRAAWRGLREAALLGELRSLAGRYSVVSALGRFAGRLPADEIDTEVRLAVAEGIGARRRASSIVQLLLRLCATPELSSRETIIVKGVALTLDGLYEGERDYCDADVLVHQSDLVAWETAAARVGASYRSVLGADHEYATITTPGALVELHATLPANVGFERGPGFNSVRPHARPPRCRPQPPGIYVVADEAAIEVTVHHFVFHHGAHPLHALRTLQDLRAITASPGAVDLLPWGSPSPRDAVVRLTALARTFATGGAPDLAARAEFVSRLSFVQNFPDSPDVKFTNAVRRWLSVRSHDGPSAWQRVVKRVARPEAGNTSRLSPLPTFMAFARRAISLSTRYAKGVLLARKAKASFGTLDSWRSFLSSPLSKADKSRRSDESPAPLQ